MQNFIQKTLPVGRLQCNCQILVCKETLKAVIVDPGDEAAFILKEIKEIEDVLGAPIQVKALLHTHAHFDHIGATRAVKEHFIAAGVDAPQIFLHQADEVIYSRLPEQGARFGFQFVPPLPVDQYLQDGQKMGVGKMKFTVLHTPGHSPGGVCFRKHEDSEASIPESVFTGDTLFRGSVGRSDLWGGNDQQLVQSIQTRIMTLSDDTIIWPGHGPSTTVGHERKTNPYLNTRA